MTSKIFSGSSLSSEEQFVVFLRLVELDEISEDEIKELLEENPGWLSDCDPERQKLNNFPNVLAFSLKIPDEKRLSIFSWLIEHPRLEIKITPKLIDIICRRITVHERHDNCVLLRCLVKGMDIDELEELCNSYSSNDQKLKFLNEALFGDKTRDYCVNSAQKSGNSRGNDADDLVISLVHNHIRKNVSRVELEECRNILEVFGFELEDLRDIANKSAKDRREKARDEKVSSAECAEHEVVDVVLPCAGDVGVRQRFNAADQGERDPGKGSRDTDKLLQQPGSRHSPTSPPRDDWRSAIVQAASQASRALFGSQRT